MDGQEHCCLDQRMTSAQTPLPAFSPPGKVRSRNMSAIRSTGTKPELYVRRKLHAAGFRFRLHRKDLDGCPDLVLPRFMTAVFVHGCFWHGHGCKRGHTPRSNTPYWSAKIGRNVSRDKRNRVTLEKAGWRVAVVWECGVAEQSEQLIEMLEIVRASAEQSACSRSIR